MRKLIFEENIPLLIREEFIQKVMSISEKLIIDPDSLMLAMYIETARTFSPSIQNKQSKATGLIQFMPSTAKNLGTSIDELKSMTAISQLDYVYKYLATYKGKMREFTDTYLAIFFPLAISKNDEWVLETKSLSAYKIASWNPLYDLNKDGKIQKKEIKSKLLSYLPKDYKL